MPEQNAKEQPAPEATEPIPRKANGWFVGGLVSAITLLMAAGTAVSLFAKLDWKADLLTHFRMQYAIGLLVTTLALAALRWRKIALISTVSLLVNLYFIAPLYLPASQSPAAAQLANDDSAPTLTLMHFNVNTANTRKADVAELIRSSNADVVFLQEISPAWVSALDGAVGPYRLESVAPRMDNFGIGMWVRDSVAVDSLRVVSVETLDITPDIAQVPALLAELNMGGETVRVLSVHTLPPVSRGYAEVRDLQLEAAGQLAQQSDMPFVLIGDLNATPWSSHYRAMVGQAGLTDSLRGRGVQVSWPAGMLKLGMIPIDHCLTRGQVVVTRRELGEATGSDHRPLYVTLKIGG